MGSLRPLGLVTLAAACGVGLLACLGVRREFRHDPTTPVARNTSAWTTEHEQAVRRAADREHRVLWVGDSIVAGLGNGPDDAEAPGTAAWGAWLAERRVLNAGVPGDGSQHVLWRLDHGLLSQLDLRGAVVLVGTNTLCGTGTEPPASVRRTVAGIRAVVHRLRRARAELPLVVVGLLPRSHDADDPVHARIERVNEELERWCALTDDVTFVDPSPGLRAAGGEARAALLPDGVHPNAEGYRVLARTLQPAIDAALND